MKRTLGLCVGLAVAVALLATPVFAQSETEQTPLSDDQRSMLSVTCTSVQQTMQRIHTNDAGVYVKRNQIHHTISDKLMSRLNARIVANKLDGGELVSAAARYTDALADFRSEYREYESQLASTIRMKCTSQPQAFYDEVAKSRQLRADTHESVMVLQQRLEEYRTAFTSFYDRQVYGEQPAPAAEAGEGVSE